VTTGIVLIGRNEGERLIAALSSVPCHVPTVYVDSASTDGSVIEAKRAGATVVELDMELPFSAARARRAGYFALCRTHPNLEFIQFVDGDCTLDPAWLPRALVEMRARPEVAAACGRRRERMPEVSIYNALIDVEWDTPIGDAEACGGDALFRRAAYEAVGGFDPALIAGEEPELCSRLRVAGWTIARLDAPMTVHDAAILRFGQWWRRAVRCGFGYAQIWSVTRSRPIVLYGRNLARALFWANLLPAAALVATPIFLAAPVALIGIYLVQIVRTALRSSLPTRLAWANALLSVVGKFAEAWGVLRFARVALFGGSRSNVYSK
jgi:cellulose synthase/poly-beta-1,6-N-acetylglucosamine synthase-like glycosyltransferase